MNLEPLQPGSHSLRALAHELSSASFALDAALRSEEALREERVREAREALEAFQLVERTPDSFAVPRKVSRRVEWALSEADRGNLELAEADVRWAGGILEKAVLEFYRRAQGD